MRNASNTINKTILAGSDVSTRIDSNRHLTNRRHSTGEQFNSALRLHQTALPLQKRVLAQHQHLKSDRGMTQHSTISKGIPANDDYGLPSFN